MKRKTTPDRVELTQR